MYEANDFHDRPLTRLLALLIFVLFAAGLFRLGRLFDTDFLEYYSAASVFLEGGNPYSPADLSVFQSKVGSRLTDPLMMFNPPWTLILLLPLPFLPHDVAHALWIALLAAGLLWSCDRLWLLSGASPSKRWISWLAAPAFFPAGHALLLGQLSPVVLTGLVAFICLMKRRSYLAAGLCGILIATKPHLLFAFWIIVLLWSIRYRCWQVLAGLAISLGIPLVLVSLWSPSIVSNYIGLIISGQPLQWATSSPGMVLRSEFGFESRWLQFLPSILGIGAAVILWSGVWRSAFDWRKNLPVILLLSTMCAFFQWAHDMTVLLPCVVPMLAWCAVRPRRNFWIPAAIAGVDLLYVHVLRATHNMFFTMWIPWVVAVMFVVAWLSNHAGDVLATPSKAE
jgi:hypothetical protein